MPPADSRLPRKRLRTRGWTRGAARIHGTAWFKNAPTLPAKINRPFEPESDDDSPPQTPTLPRSTHVKLYIGGKQARPTPATAWRCVRPMDDCWGSSAGQSQGHSQRGRGGAQARRGRKLRRTIARRFSTTARRIFPSADEIAHRLADVVGEEQAAAEVELSIGAFFRMRRGR